MPSFIGSAIYIAGNNSTDPDARWYNYSSIAVPIEYSYTSSTSLNKTNPYADTFTIIAFGETYAVGTSTKIADNFVGSISGPATEAAATIASRPSGLLSLVLGVSSENIPTVLNPVTQQIPRGSNPKEVRTTPISGIAIRSPRESVLNVFVVSYVSVPSNDTLTGPWQSDYNGFAVSSSAGKPLSKPSRLIRMNNASRTDPWQQLFFSRQTIFDEYIYIFGTTNGSAAGPLKLSRIRQDRLLDLTAYPSPLAFWDGNSWSDDRNDAITLFTDSTLYPSVMWHQATGQWLMTYVGGNKIPYLRKSPNVWGPWSAAEQISSSPVYNSVQFLERTSNFTNPWVVISLTSLNPYLSRLAL